MNETSIPSLFDILGSSQNLAADDVLLESLDDLEPDYRVQAVETLLARQQSHALTQLVDRYDQLPADCQAVLSRHIELLEGTLRHAMRSAAEQSRSNAIALVSHCRAHALSYLLSMGLHCASSNTRTRSASALRDLAAHLLNSNDCVRYTPSHLIRPKNSYKKFVNLRSDRDMLATTLRDALANYDSHLCTSVVEATAMLSLDLETEILAEARKLRSRYWRTVLQTLKYAPKPMYAGVVLQTLKVKDARPRIADLLATCRDDEFMQAVMESSWLLGDAEIRQGCKWIRRLQWLETSQTALFEMSAATFRQTVRFIGATAIDDAQKLEWYRSILESDQVAKQFTALTGLAAIESASSCDVLRTALDWAGPDLCRLATTILRARNNGDGSDTPANYRASSFPSGGESFRTARRCRQFGEFWAGYGGMSEVVRRTVARKLLLHDPGFIDALTSKLKSADAAERVRAISVIRGLRLADRFREVILHSALDPDRFVRSAAVRTLSQIQSPASERLLCEALTDADYRVRANAVEAMDEIQSLDRPAKLAPTLQDDHHRVRAAAIKSLLKLHVRDAAETLLRMLQDSSRTHKISALWVVEKHGLAGILSRVAALAHEDPDEVVRKRARRLLRAERRQNRRRSPPVPAPTEKHEV